jgi:hypothetical protein
MIVDEHVGIQGNGNQDTQSWFHSMEVNIMIDSYEICRDWLDQLKRNQSKSLLASDCLDLRLMPVRYSPLRTGLAGGWHLAG